MAGGSASTALPRTGERLSSFAYETIKGRLLDGEWAAGQRISLEALKAEFGVSKQPIMDAVRRLASDGLIEILPQVGCRVPTRSLDEVTDFYTMFAGMEGAIASLAAQRWTGSQLDELRAVNAEVTDLAGNADAPARSHGYRVMNRAFHTRIYDMASSRVIADMSRRMWDLSDLLINTAGVPQPLATAVRERAHDHDDICDALAARDAVLAREAMERHIITTIDIIHAELRDAAGT